MTDFELYLKKYCAQNKITKEEACQHALVKEVKKLYKVKEEPDKVGDVR